MNRMMKTISPALFGLTFAACASAPPPPPPKPVAPAPKAEVKKADPLEAANDSFAKGRYDEALRDYDAILKSQPQHETAAFNRAVTLHKLGKTAEAGAAYKAFLADHPDHVEATLNLGAVLRDQNHSEDAIGTYKKFLIKHPYESRVLNNLTVLYREKRDYRSATETVRTLLMRDQKNIDAYKNLALIHYDQEKYRLAQTILANALKMAQEQKIEDADIHVNFGLTHLKLGDKGKAMASFKKAVEINPKHVLANYNIGALSLTHRDYNLAAKSFEVCIKAWPNDPEVVASLGYSYQGQQKFTEAATQLEKAKAMFAADKTEPVVYQLMVVFQAAEQPKKALEYGNELLKIKSVTCKDDEYEGLCGRINGIKLTLKMELEGKEKKEKKKASGEGAKLFTDAPAEGDEGAAPAPEGAPPADGAAPAPAEDPKAKEKAPSPQGGK